MSLVPPFGVTSTANGSPSAFELSADIAIIQEAPINIANEGATLDGAVAGDDAAWASAFSKLPSTGGEIYMPRGVSRIYNPWSFASRRNVRIIGESTENDVMGQGSTILYAGTGATAAIDARKTVGFEMEGVNIGYASNSFTGYLVDFRNDSGSGANDTRKGGLKRCTLSGTNGSWVSAAALVCLANAVDMTFEKVRFQGGAYGVIGRVATGDYSNVIRFNECDFGSNGTAHVKNAGDAWKFDACVIEGLQGGVPGFYTFDAGMGDGTKGMVLNACWMGDATALGGLGCQMNWSGNGLTLVGGLLAVETAGLKGIIVAENSCEGIVILGTQGVGPGTPMVDFGATTGHTSVLILPAHLEASMVALGGTVPASALSYDPATSKLRFGTVSLAQDGASAGLKTDGYLAATTTLFGVDGSLTGNLAINTAGKGVRIKEGSNARMGTSALTAGSVVVSNTSVSANTRIFLSRSTLGGTAGHLSYTISAATSFTITSSTAADTSTIAWQLVEGL